METGNKIVVVIGAAGNIGSYVCERFAREGYEIQSITREDGGQLEYLVSGEPFAIINLGGVTNTFNPYWEVDVNLDANLRLTLETLEAIRCWSPNTRYFQASSCLVFGRDTKGSQNEHTKYSPLHPYGVMKMAAQELTAAYRRDRNLFSCSGILYPTESERRKPGFFTKKVVQAAVKIGRGEMDTLVLGDLNASRDWTHSEDVADAIYLMMTANNPDDYIIGSGTSTQLRTFVDMCFSYVGLDYRHFVVESQDPSRIRDFTLKADTTKIMTTLGWRPKLGLQDIVVRMMDYELKQNNI